MPCNVYEQNMDQQFEINVKGLTIEVVKTSSCGLLTLWGTPSLLQFSLKNRSRSLSERVAAHTTSSGPDESKEGDGQGRSCRVWVYGTFSSSSSSSFCIDRKRRRYIYRSGTHQCLVYSLLRMRRHPNSPTSVMSGGKESCVWNGAETKEQKMIVLIILELPQ